MTDQEMVAYLARCQLDPRCRVRRSRRCCTRSSRTRTSTTRIRTRSERSSAVPMASGSPRECFGADAVWIPVPAARVCALEARRRGGRRASRGEGRAARQARSRHLGRDGGGVLRGNARCDQPRRGVRRGARARRRGIRQAQPSKPLGRDRPRGRCSPPILPACAAPSRPTARGSCRSTRRPRCSSSPADRGLAHALPGGRRMPRPPRAHAAPAGLGRVRPRLRGRRRRCRSG